ncbi:ParB N-terminal domain-containing protein (plasmid) [Streptomyces sp. NBC_01520]|uniref:ParB/RepB/Spo0J family partition protein n=1 Tax=Streptomyces sp. NBC_01520 TaxID=2903892 RepID=UPI0038634B3A
MSASRVSAAERAGASAAFGAARAPRSTRGQIIDSVVGTPPASVSPDLVAENPENPREEYDKVYITSLGQNMREVGQIQAATVMTRLAFLVSHPEHKEAIPSDREYVAIDGHCRLRAARQAGIDLRITVDDSPAGTREDLLAAALSANHFRKDLTPIEEAKAIEALVEFHGSAAAVVSVLGGAINDSWISTRRALLKLPDEIQQKVADKEVPIAIARKAGSLPSPEERTAYVDTAMAERAAAQAEKPKPVRGRAAAAAKRQTSPAAAEPVQETPPTPPAGTTTAMPATSVPEPRGETSTALDSESTLDWTDPDGIAAAILERCSPAAVEEIAQKLLSSL